MQSRHVGFEGGSSNLYAYLLNDSINEVDPYGLAVNIICAVEKDSSNKEACKAPKRPSRGRVIAYLLYRFLSKNVEDADEGGATPQKPKPLLEEPTPISAPPNPKTNPPIDPNNPVIRIPKD